MASLHPDAVPPARVERAAGVVLGLLGRPWAAQGRVLIKPTNQVNRILPLLLRVSPQSRVLLLHSRSEEHTSELQSLMRISYAVFCLKKKNKKNTQENRHNHI